MAHLAESLRSERAQTENDRTSSSRRTGTASERRPWRNLVAKRMVGVQILRNLGGIASRPTRLGWACSTP